MLQEVSFKCPSLSPWVEYCYKQPSCLFYGDNIIKSAQGIQQGDPLGPLLFALVLQPLAIRIEKDCQLGIQCWYLDDGTLIGDTVEVAKAFRIIQEEGPRLGLTLNVSKTELFWPSQDKRIESMMLFPNEISRPVSGVRLLGGGVSLDANFHNELASKRVLKTKQLMESVKELDDPQLELMFLRACIGVSKLFFALRTSPPSGFIDAEEQFDAALRCSLDQIVTGGNSGFGELQFRMATLPIKHGGLGTLSVSDIRCYAFLASFVQSLCLQSIILKDDSIGKGKDYTKALQDFQDNVGDCEALRVALDDYVPPRKLMKNLAEAHFKVIVESMVTDYTLSPRQKAVWDCVRAPHSQDYLYTLPIVGLGQVMSANEYRSVLKYRLMVPMFMDEMVCCGCNKFDMDTHGDHAVQCKADPGIMHRHDMVRDGLFDILRRAGIAARREAPISLTKEGSPNLLRPADVLIYNWIQGKNTCIDLTCCSPLVGLNKGYIDHNKALETQMRNKYMKHDGACQEAGLEFVPFGFTSFGGLSEEAIELMERVEKITHQHLVCQKSTKFVFHRLGFIIQKGVAAQIVRWLPINFVNH